MSRIGRAPVQIPAGVTVDVQANVFTVKGPKGTLSQDYDPKITITVEGGVATLTSQNRFIRQSVTPSRKKFS